MHCISGWDRTPLYISLIRLSLWADGLIHTSLNANEILYLTLAYDWLLFHHYLKDRSARGEDILYFCFTFLQHITSDEYSISTIDKSLCSAISNSNGTPILGKGSADSYAGSFGSSWEVVGYLQSHVIKAKSPPQPGVPVPVLQVSKATPVKSPASDDGIFSMDDEENHTESSLDDDFTLLGTETPDVLKQEREPAVPLRAQRLMEVRETMLKIYRQVLAKQQLTSSASGLSSFLGVSSNFNFNLFSSTTSQIVVKSTN